jgi:hypothetical protein
MKPGRELDALIAEKVMGWGPIEIDRNGNPVGINPDYPSKFKCHIVPNYSTDIAAAWTVVEKLKLCVWPTTDGRYLCLLDQFSLEYGDEYWFGGSNVLENIERDWIAAVAQTAPHAICLAALKTVK